MNLTPAQQAALAKLAERGHLSNGNARFSTVAASCGWEVIDTPHNVDGWTVNFRKRGRATIRVRFSATGIVTRLNGVDFATGVTSNPTRDKNTRLGHWLTEAIN